MTTQEAFDLAEDVEGLKNSLRAVAFWFNLDPAKVELFTQWGPG